MLLLSGGAWGAKFDDKTKSTLRRWGFILTFFGGLLTVIVSILQIWSSYSSPIIFFIDSIWAAVIPYIISPRFLIAVGLVGLSIIGLRHLTIKQIEKGYKLKTTPVITPIKEVGGYRMANILVENIGRGKFTCAAKLTKVMLKDLNGKTFEEIDVSDLNPYGRSLKWEKRYPGSDYAILSEGIPNTIELLISHRETYTYGPTMIFCFADDDSTPPIPFGYYKIAIDFIRWNGKRHEKLSTFEETLKVDYGVVEWINRGNEKPKEAKPKKKERVKAPRPRATKANR